MDGTWNRRRGTNIEPMLEVMMGLKFNISCTMEYIECAEDEEESDSAEIRFGLKVCFLAYNGAIVVGRLKVDNHNNPTE